MEASEPKEQKRQTGTRLLHAQFNALQELLDTGDEAVISLVCTKLLNWSAEVTAMQSFNSLLKQKASTSMYFDTTVGLFCFLPEEVYFQVLCFLPACDVAALACTCSRFSSITKDEILWKFLCLRDFSPIENKAHLQYTKTWRWLYQSKAVKYSLACLVGWDSDWKGCIYQGEWKDGKYEGYGLRKSGILISEGLWQAGKLMEGHLSDISYEGSVREGRRHGYGVSIQKKNKYEGDWLEDKRNGTGKLFAHDGRLQYDGEWRDDFPEGAGKRFSKQTKDLKYVGQWHRGKRHGRGTSYYAKGGSYKGDWVDDRKSGMGVFIFINGGKYEGEWKDNNRHGKGVAMHSSGDSYSGEWKNNKREGYGVQRWKNGTVYQGQWKNNKRDGAGTTTTPTGDEYSGEWKNDKKHGKGVMVMKSPGPDMGYRYEGVWVEGKKDGPGVAIAPEGHKELVEWAADERILPAAAATPSQEAEKEEGVTEELNTCEGEKELSVLDDENTESPRLEEETTDTQQEEKAEPQIVHIESENLEGTNEEEEEEQREEEVDVVVEDSTLEGGAREEGEDVQQEEGEKRDSPSNNGELLPSAVAGEMRQGDEPKETVERKEGVEEPHEVESQDHEVEPHNKDT